MFAVLGFSLLTGCGQSGRADRVTTDGSSSMEKVIGMLGETFRNETGIAVTCNPTGSGSGIRAVQEGRCDIGLSSRELTEEERAAGLTATLLAYDGIAVIVNPANPVSDLAMEELARIYTGEISNWLDVGGTEGEIVLIGREAGSGTRVGFETASGTEGICCYRQELTAAGDVITAVSQNPAAIGYTSAAAVKDTVKVLTVDGAAVTEESVRSGRYGVRRPFLLVTRGDAELGEAARRFFDYATSADAAELISAAGAVSAH